MTKQVVVVDLPAEKQKCHKLLKIVPPHHLVPPTEDLLAETARGVLQVDLVAQLRLRLGEVDRVQLDALDTLLWYFSQQFSKYTSLNYLTKKCDKLRKHSK